MPETQKPKIDPALVEQKEKQGVHQFDPHIVVPNPKDKHSSGAILSGPGIRTLPNKESGLRQPSQGNVEPKQQQLQQPPLQQIGAIGAITPTGTPLK